MLDAIPNMDTALSDLLIVHANSEVDVLAPVRRPKVDQACKCHFQVFQPSILARPKAQKTLKAYPSLVETLKGSLGTDSKAEKSGFVFGFALVLDTRFL